MGGGPRYEYMRAADEIAARIRRGQWKFGGRLPGRAELARIAGASEMTVRRAVRELEERGIVRVAPSSGTYVTWRPGERFTDTPHE